jgi:phenylalanyl-tRNA synthetase alpha chain
LVNTLKTEIETALDERRSVLESTRRPAGAIDVTLPGRKLPMGRIHPLMRVRREVEDIFAHMGYEILEGPEVEDDFHNFEALNMPPDHPRRDMQDTLYLDAPIAGGTWGAHRGKVPEAQVRAATLLRTHTSAMQIRYMKTFRRRCASSCRAGCTDATTSISATRRCFSSSKGSWLAKASRSPI